MKRRRLSIIVLALAIATGTVSGTEVDKDEAIRELEEMYGEVSVSTMVWTLNPRRPDHLRLFLEAGIPATTRLTFGEGEDAYDLSLLQYTLQFACDGDETTEIVRILVDEGVDPGEPSPKTSWTPLMQAIGCPSIVRVLLRAGADPDYTNDRGETALYLAMFRHVPEESVRLLLQADADAKSDRERLLRMAGDTPGKKSLLEAALAKPDPKDLEPREIHRAILERKVDVVREWLAAHPDAGGVIDGESGIMTLTDRCSIDEDAERVIELLDLLLANGADVNVTDDTMKDTPLHVAARRCPTPFVARLLDAGAKIDAKNIADQTPLFLAVFNDHPGAAELLLDAGSKVDRNTKFFANNKPEMKKLLKKKR